MLTPQKNRAGQRIYRRRDVEIALRIKQLREDEGLTVAGAKKKLASELRSGTKLKVVTPEMVQEQRQQSKETVSGTDLTQQQQRLIHKLIPLNERHREDQQAIRAQVWDFYADLKKYRSVK